MNAVGIDVSKSSPSQVTKQFDKSVMSGLISSPHGGCLFKSSISQTTFDVGRSLNSFFYYQ